MESQKQISRRQFVKGAGVGAVSMAGAAAWAPVTAFAAEVPEKWDDEADVVIVGAGTAGMPAAVEAIRAGADTLVLESETEGGGSYLLSGSMVSMAQKGEENDFYDFLENRLVQTGSKPETVKAYADSSTGLMEFFEELGVMPTSGPVPAVPQESVPPGIRTDFAWYTDKPKLYGAFEEFVKDKGRLLFEHRATQLITDCSGAVIGVQVDAKGKPLNVKARRGVVLAAGGFGANPKLLKLFGGPAAAAQVPRVPESHRGDGLLMAWRLGANMLDLFEGTSGYQGSPVPVDFPTLGLYSIVPISMVVNKNARRFVNEAVHYSELTIEVLKQPDVTEFVIFDDSIRNSEALSAASIPAIEDYDTMEENGGMIKADTIEDLADLLELDPDKLKESLDTYNKSVAAGSDAEFGKVDKYLFPISTPPFYAIVAKPSIILSRPGVEIDANAQVKNVFDELIPRLYAAGDTAGGIFANLYVSGCAVGSSMVFGRIAGKNAAAEEPWDED